MLLPTLSNGGWAAGTAALPTMLLQLLSLEPVMDAQREAMATKLTAFLEKLRNLNHG